MSVRSSNEEAKWRTFAVPVQEARIVTSISVSKSEMRDISYTLLFGLVALWSKWCRHNWIASSEDQMRRGMEAPGDPLAPPIYLQGLLTLRRSGFIHADICRAFLNILSGENSKLEQTLNYENALDNNIMDKTQDFKSLQDQIQASLLSTTRVANQISAEDLGFQRSLDPAVGTSLDEQSARLLALSSALLKSAASIADLRVPALEDSEDVDNNWRGVVDIVDSLLEKTDTCLDEYTGVIKRREIPAVEQVRVRWKLIELLLLIIPFQATQKSKKNGNLGNAFRNQNLLKPQLAFDVKPDNNDTSPWKPLLTTKPHAIQPLEESMNTFTNEFDQIQYDYSTFLPLLLLPPTPSTPEA